MFRVWTGIFGTAVVRVVFSDDTGRGSLNQEPVTLAAAAMFNIDAQWEPFVTDFEALEAGVYGSDDTERKGAWLVKRAAAGDGHAKRFLEGVLALPRRHLIPIFYGAVDRHGFQSHQDYLAGVRGQFYKAFRTTARFDVAFLDCLTRIDTYANTFVPRERIIWIADNGGNETEAKKLELRWRRLNETMRAIMTRIDDEHQRTGQPKNALAHESWARVRLGLAGQSIQPATSHVIDTIYFGNSKESRALQLVDVCAAVICAQLRGSAGSAYYELLRPQVVNDGMPPLFTEARPWFGMSAVERRERRVL